MNHTLVHAARVAFRNKAIELGKPTFLSTGFLPFNNLCIQRRVLAVQAIISNDNIKATLYVPSLLAQTNSQTVTSNVTGKQFIMLKHRLTASENCFYYRAVKFWNALPMSLTTILSENTYKRNLHDTILTKI